MRINMVSWKARPSSMPSMACPAPPDSTPPRTCAELGPRSVATSRLSPILRGMRKRHIATFATVALLASAGTAAAQSPADTEYGAGGAGGSGGAGAPAGSGDLPFTGFEAGIIALGGAGLAATGLILRRTARAQRH